MSSPAKSDDCADDSFIAKPVNPPSVGRTYPPRWQPAALPENEAQRLTALREYRILDSVEETAYDDLVTIAAAVCGVPIALISLIDSDRQWFKAKVGTDAPETPRDMAFCAHAILQTNIFEINDAALDDRFAENPLVAAEPKIRFYAGSPLINAEGFALGTLCVIDREPRQLEPQQRAALAALGRQVIALLDLRQTGRALQAANRRNDQFFASLQYGAMSVGLDWIIRSFNPAAERLTGWSAGEVVGVQTPLFLHCTDDLTQVAQVVGERVGRVVAPGRELFAVLANELHEPTREWVMRRKDGSSFPGILATSVMTDDAGAVVGYVGIVTDISRQKDADAQLLARTERLQRANLELDQFAYIVSHDLRAPLRAIATLTDWMIADLKAGLVPLDPLENLNLMRSRVHRMDALIAGILEHARIGRQAPKIALVDVRKMLAETIDSLAPPAGFQVVVEGEMPVFATVAVRLQQIFANLIGNAVKYHHDRPRGHAWVSCADEGEFYKFTVRDDGPGIDPKYHHKLFQMFQTLHNRDDIESTGIGLATVRKIVEDLGGEVGLDSALGAGAAFSFTWPKSMPIPDELTTSRFPRSAVQPPPPPGAEKR